MSEVAAAPEGVDTVAAVNGELDADTDFETTTIGSLMSPPVGIFKPDQTVAQAVEQLRAETQTAFITYGYVTDEAGKLLGVVVMREMLLAKPGDKLSAVMIPQPFSFDTGTVLPDALQDAAKLHYPAYPVTKADGTLAGIIRGEELFRNQVIEISAQAGKMVGVDKTERLDTSIKRSLFLRHPWLQINLLTAFVAAAVVGFFEETLAQLVILAVFLPVMAGQTGNTGSQALAVTVRGMTLGDLESGSEGKLVWKEGILGTINGALVGITAGIGMYAYAAMTGGDNAVMLGVVVFISMVVACVISGIAGAIIPILLKKAGADPAAASSIFLTTMSDIASMGVFLGLATIMLL
ncbi:magnesium transporter [Paraurantiacibacter namhicola]|uniref:Magnesium transporter MgtE n=1 Tax=Paraurantiacibacter namhicola TaxID=645517 RepID=A0A1C7DBL5_9SPHN|nr:magnesium transporter [Paraurantiacibacter namhicola]ANU08711.1 Magnesium transporter MgtE [Paraurantiacibacter namhicola]